MGSRKRTHSFPGKKTHLTFLFHITCKEIVSNVERPCDFSQPSTVCNQETYRIHGSDLRIFLFRPGEVSSMHFSPRPSCVFVSRSFFSLRIVSQGSNILREKKRRDAKPVSVVFDTKVLDFLQSFLAPAVTSFHLLLRLTSLLLQETRWRCRVNTFCQPTPFLMASWFYGCFDNYLLRNWLCVKF